MTETARMYGGSLYDLAAEEGLETRILGELDESRNSFLRQARSTCGCSAPPASPRKSAAACWTKPSGIGSTSMC